MYTKKGNMYPAYVSKHNSNREKKVILMISNGEKWHYITAKKNQLYYYDELHQKIMVILIAWIFFIFLEQKKLIWIKINVKINIFVML